MLVFSVHFLHEDDITSEFINDSSDWKNAIHIPRSQESIYLGEMGKGYHWYTVKTLRWFDSKSVTVVLYNKRDEA